MRNYIAAALIAAAVATAGCSGKSANSTPASTIASQPAVAASTPLLDAHTASAAIDTAYASTASGRYDADPIDSWPAVAAGPNRDFLHALVKSGLATERVEHRILTDSRVYAYTFVRPRLASADVSGDVGAPAFHVADRSAAKIIKITAIGDNATVAFHPGLEHKPWARGVAISGVAADEVTLRSATCTAQLTQADKAWATKHIDCPHSLDYIGVVLTSSNSQRIAYPRNLSVVASTSDMSGMTTYPCAYEPPSTMETLTGGNGHLRIPRGAPRDVAMFYPIDPSALQDYLGTAGKCAANS